MSIQEIPPEYLPEPATLPDQLYELPELRYPPRLNAAEELVDGAIERGFGDRIAFYFRDGRITYAELQQQVNRVGNAFKGLDVRPGDRVLLRLPDSPELVFCILALQKIGAVPVPTYTLSRAQDLIYRENDTEAKVIVSDAGLLDEVEKARSGFRFAKHFVAVPNATYPGYSSYEELVAGAPETLTAAGTGREDLALILYTSGSTGEPKGCWHTHSDTLAIADTYARYYVQATPDDVFAGPPPIPFALGFGFFLVFPLRFGAAAVLADQKTPEVMLRSIERYRVTVFAAVATYYGMLLEQLASSGVERFASDLRLLLCGGEPLAARVAAGCEQTFGLALIQFLGTTEMLHNIVSYRADEPPRSGSFGRAVPGYQVAVRDPGAFMELPRGEPGLLTVRGPTGTKYWRKPEQQQETVREGWNVVRDIVRMDEDGYLYYIARSDEMIVSAGYNIAPADVENVLLRHPAVLKVACIGAPDPQGHRSRVVKACVVLRSGYEPSDALVRELQEFFKANAPPFMYPRLVEFLPELPETLTGKIRRSELLMREITASSEPDAAVNAGSPDGNDTAGTLSRQREERGL